MNEEAIIRLSLTVEQVNRLLELIAQYSISEWGSLFNEIVTQAKSQTDDIIE